MKSPESVFDFVRSMKSGYESLRIPLDDGREFSQYETIRKINHYWSSEYVDDAEDEVIGKYPFDNVSKFRVLLEARATDFDTKHVEVEPKDADRETRVRAMVATKALRRHLRDINWDHYVNDFTLKRAKYGGVLTSVSDGVPTALNWENIITDQSDIMGGIRILRHYLTPSEMLKKAEVWKNVKDAVRKADEWRDKDVSASGYDKAKTQGDVIEVFEIQGNVPRSMLKEAQAVRDGEEYDPWAEDNEDDRYEYVEVKIVACGADWMTEREDAMDRSKKVKDEEGIVLYAEEEETTHYYLARNPEAGRGLGVGIVEDLFQHQKWHNFTKTEEMRLMAIAGKHLLVTDDPDVLANVYGPGVKHGTVLKLGQGKTLTQLNQAPTSLPVYQGMRSEWSDSADKVTSSYPAILGEESKAGTPFRAQFQQNQQAASQFEQYREEIGIHFRDIITEKILPDALMKAAKEDAIYESFTPQELQLIDETILTLRVNEEVKKRTLAKAVVTPDDLLRLIEETKASLQRQGNKRQLKDIKGFIKDAGGAVVIHTSDEMRSKQVFYEGVSNFLNILAPEDPRRNALIDRLFDHFGITSAELALYAQQAPPPAAPVPGQAPQAQGQPQIQAPASPVPGSPVMA